MEQRSFICVILAGGRGERLYPITQTRPKPLCPVGNASCLSRCIAKAKQAGAKEIIVTACYMADAIEKEVKTQESVKAVAECKPLGTAGCVRACVGDVDCDVLVMSGDGVNDFDVSAFVRSFDSDKYACSVALTKNSFPTEYGAVKAKNGRIICFSEKPQWKNVTGDLINAGLYMLSPRAINAIPKGVKYDFASDLFPYLLASDSISAWETNGYWCDIGTPQAMYDCSMLFTGGKNAVSPSASIHKDASVKASIVMENCEIKEKAVVDGSIICENVVINKNALVSSGCIIGGGSVIGENAVICQGVIIGENSVVNKGEKVMKNMFFGKTKGRLFDSDNGIGGLYGETFTVSDGVALGRALSEAASSGKKRIGVMYGNTSQSELLYHGIITGVRYGGGSAYQLGRGFASLCSFSNKEYSLDFGVFVSVSDEGKVEIYVFDSQGRELEGNVKKTIERLWFSEGKGGDRILPSYVPNGFDMPLYIYTNRLYACLPSLSGLCLWIDNSKQVGNVLSSVLFRMGADIRDSGEKVDRIYLSDDGFDCKIQTKSNAVLDKWKLLCYYLGEKSKVKDEIIVPEDTPLTVIGWAGKDGASIRRAESEYEGKDNDLAYRDMCFLITCVCGMMPDTKSGFDRILEAIPEFSVKEIRRDYPEDSRAEKMASLCDDSGKAYYTCEAGNVRITPTNRGFRIFAEAVNEEYASELCDLGLGKIDTSR